METVMKMLKEIEQRIQVLAFSEKERYDNYIKRIQAIKQDLSSLDDRDNTIGEKNRVMEEIGMLDLETKMYIEYGTNFDKNEDITLTLEAKGQASGKEKAKQARIELYKSICEDLKKLEEINLEDIKKIKKQWDIEKESSLEYSIFEIEQIEEALSEVLLNYYIKYFNQHKTVPEKLDINEYCNIEVFIKKIKEVLIIHISQHNGLKKLEYINLLNDFSKAETRQLKPEYRNNFTFLTEEQCVDRENMLKIFKRRGLCADITDFSILLGGDSSDAYCKKGETKTGYYWTKSDVCKQRNEASFFARAIDMYGGRHTKSVFQREIGARPVLYFSSLDSIPRNEGSLKRAKDGVLEVEYGYYPQKAVSRKMQDKLEKELENGRITETGNTYTTDSSLAYDVVSKFSPQQHPEYQYKGKRYVRISKNLRRKTFFLSNGEKYYEEEPIWLEVSPIKWWVDEKAKIMITEKIMFAGVQFKHEGDYKTEDFDKTDIKQFMDKYWSKDILQVLKQQQLESKSSDDFEGR